MPAGAGAELPPDDHDASSRSSRSSSPPQTNIKSSSYSIAGVDPKQPGIGLVTPSLLSSGRFLTGGDEALVAGAYAGRQGLKLGSTLDLNGTKLKVVGLVKPPLGGQTADIYIPLAKLQALRRAGHASSAACSGSWAAC